MPVSAISPFAWLRIGIHFDYSIIHASESMPLAYAALETRPPAADHSGGSGSASGASLGQPSDCRALANGPYRKCRV